MRRMVKLLLRGGLRRLSWATLALYVIGDHRLTCFGRGAHARYCPAMGVFLVRSSCVTLYLRRLFLHRWPPLVSVLFSLCSIHFLLGLHPAVACSR